MRLIAWTWLILPLGVSRATQIVLNDKILEKARDFIDRHGTSYMKYSIGCPWCTSMQLSLVAVALLAWDFTRQVTLWILVALAASLLAVVLDRLVDRFTPDPPPPPPVAVRPEAPEAVIRALEGQ